MKDSATYAKKSLEINSKKYKFHKDSTNPHAPSLPANTDGQPTCKESWNLKLWGNFLFNFRDSSMSNYMVSKKTM